MDSHVRVQRLSIQSPVGGIRTHGSLRCLISRDWSDPIECERRNWSRGRRTRGELYRCCGSCPRCECRWDSCQVCSRESNGGERLGALRGSSWHHGLGIQALLAGCNCMVSCLALYTIHLRICSSYGARRDASARLSPTPSSFALSFLPSPRPTGHRAPHPPESIRLACRSPPRSSPSPLRPSHRSLP